MTDRPETLLETVQRLEAEKTELTEERRQNTSAMQAGLEAIEQLEAEKKELEVRIANAMKHHTRKRPAGFYEEWCDECDVVWPCPTVAGLEGEE